MYLTATSFAASAPLSLPLRYYKGVAHPSAMPFAIALNVASWIAQFIGHGVFEKRAPALFNNLTQGEFDPHCVSLYLRLEYADHTALVLAPFFVHLEMLFTFFNCKLITAIQVPSSSHQLTAYTDKPELHKKMKNAAGKRIRDMNQAAKMSQAAKIK